MNTCTISFARYISTSCINYGKRNFRKIKIVNKRGMQVAKDARTQNPNDEYLRVDRRGLKLTGYTDENGEYHDVPERIPEIIVPDLTNFPLKAYVSYKADGIVQPEFTAESLFNMVYANKIIDDYDNKKLNEDGSSMEPNENELMTSDEAKDKASKTGTDIFTSGDKRPSWLY